MRGPLLAVQPEHVSISFLISALVAPPPPEQGWGLGFDGPTAQRLLALFLIEEVQDISSPTLTPLPLLLTNLQQQLGQAGIVLAHALVGILRGLSSPDDIVTVLHNFSTLLAQPGSTPAVATDACSIAYIATTSPLGMFLRRVRLGLSSMSIQGLAALSEQIQQQLQQLATQQYQAASSSRSAGSGALKDQAVLEAYVNQLLSAVETQGQSLPAGLIDAATARLSQLQLELPKLEYLKMAVSLAHKDMHAALSSLHKYFDSSGSALSGGGSTAAAAGPGITASGLAAAAASKGKGKHQAALHSLSALHAALGHPQEALAALEELLRLGQQAGDEWGLLHALAGLCRVMGMSEGLQLSSNQAGSSGTGQTAAAAWVGWGLLDLRCTEQQLQLQTLLQRCLSTARDMRAPHIAAYAAVALCRFKLQHAASTVSGSSGSGEAAGGAAAEAAASASSESSAAAGVNLLIQRMLLDVATLEHQAAIAAAAPSTPAVVAAPSNTAGALAPHLAARSTALYPPSDAFGTGTNTTVVTTLSAAAAATAATTKAQPVGLGWRSSAAAVSQALATAHLIAASALQSRGANSLAAVQLLMLLTGPGGDAGSRTAAEADPLITQQQQQQPQGPKSAVECGQQQQQLSLMKGLGCVTGCGVRFEDIVAGWVLVSDLIARSHGTAAGEYAVSLAAAHFPIIMPEQLSAAQQQLRLQAALQLQDMQSARQACQALQNLTHQHPQLALELQLAAAEADASAQAAAGCWQEAHAAAASLFAVAAAAGMQSQAVKALLMMAKTSMQAGDVAGALPYALSAMLQCQQLQLDALLPEAVLLVASAWQDLAPHGSRFAVQMLQQVMPVVCVLGDLKLQAEVAEALGKSIMSIIQDNSSWPTAEAAAGRDAASAGKSPATDQHKRDSSTGEECCSAGHRLVLRDAGHWLAAAGAMHEQAGCWSAACDAWLMLAHLYDALGEEGLRNSAALKWHAASRACCWPGSRVSGYQQE